MSNDAGSRRGVQGDLFVLSAPSGAGKTTVIRRLLERLGAGGGSARGGALYYSVSHTTRLMRDGEIDGRDYHFVALETFERMIGEDAFLEWADVHGQMKGTAKAPVLDRLARGIDVLVDVDVQGAATVRERHPAAVSCFLMPPSFAELRRRLLARGLDSERQIARRLLDAERELRQVEHYDYVMINDDVEEAVRALDAVIRACRQRRERLRPIIDHVLSDLPAPASQPGSGSPGG